MKERYWTTRTIKRKAAAILSDVQSRNRPHLNFGLANSALLILDMQRFFFQPDSHAFIPSAPAIIPGSQQIIRLYRHHHRPVIFTRHINTTQNAAMMKEWWRDLIEVNNPLSQLIPGISVLPSEIIIKTQYDAFYKTPLAAILKKRRVKQLVICGVHTNLCCETTARAAFVRGFEVLFPADGTACYNEQFHRATLLNLAYGFARVCLIQDLIKKDN